MIGSVQIDNDSPCFFSRIVLRGVSVGLCLLAIWSILHQPDRVPVRLTDVQMMEILTTHCPALRQQPDVLGCLPDPAGILLITDRPALMQTQVAGLPVVTKPPPPHLPPPPGVIVLHPDGPDPQPTLSHCPPGYTEQQKYRWRFCNSPANPQPIPTSLMTPPIAGVPYARAEAIFQRQDFMELPGVRSVGLGTDGIVVQTSEPVLIPSTFEGLPVQAEAPKGVPRPSNHTSTTVPSPLKGGVLIGDQTNVGTLGGFVRSSDETWLVTTAHTFESKCGDVPPCPANVPLHECPQTHANGIPAKLAPSSSSPQPVSTLTRWTRLTNNVTVDADAAAGFVDVTDREISRHLEGFSRMVTGREATPMLNEAITMVTAVDSGTIWGRSYMSLHLLTGTVTATMDNLTDVNNLTDTAADDAVEFECNSPIVVGLRDTIRLNMNSLVLPGTSGALVINGNGDILGMHNVAAEARQHHSTTGELLDVRPTNIAWAVKAAHIRTALNFEKWVGSETVPLEGAFVSLDGARPTIKG